MYVVARLTSSSSDISLTTSDLAAALKESNRAGSGYVVYEVQPVNVHDTELLETAAKESQEAAEAADANAGAGPEVTEPAAQKQTQEAAVFDSRSSTTTVVESEGPKKESSDQKADQKASSTSDAAGAQKSESKK